MTSKVTGFISLCLVHLLMVRQVCSFTAAIFPNDLSGTAVTTYTILLVKEASLPYPDLNTTLKSVVVQFPPEYTMAGSGYTCKYESAPTACSYQGMNKVAVAVNIPNNTVSSITLEIAPITNPAVETGTVIFLIEMMSNSDGSGSILATKTFAINPNLKAPDFQSISMAPVPSPSVVFSQDSVILTFSPSSNIAAGSLLYIQFPAFFPDFSLSYIVAGSMSCTPVQNIAAGVNCVYDETTNTLKVSSAFTGTVSTGTSVQLRINGVLYPASLSTVTGIKVSLLTSTEKRFNRNDNVGLTVTQPRPVTDFNVTLANNTVGSKGRLIHTFLLPGPVSQNSKLTIGMTGFDSTSCNLISSLGFTSTDCTLFTFGSNIANNTQVTIILNNLINNNQAVPGTINFKITDAAGKDSYTCADKQFNFTLLTIEGVNITIDDNRLGAQTNLAAAYFSKIAYSSGTKINVKVPTAISLPPTPTCSINSVASTCTVLPGSPPIVQFTSASALAQNTNVSVSIAGVILPLCVQTITISVEANLIEEGFGDLTGLTVSSFTGTGIAQNSQVVQEANTLKFNLISPVPLQVGSRIRLTFPRDVINPQSAPCSVSGLDSGATCGSSSSGVIDITNAITSSKATGSSFAIDIGPLTNPRAIAGYPILVEFLAPSPSTCSFISSSYSLQVTVPLAFSSIVSTASHSTLATFHSLNFMYGLPITPQTGDKITFVSPGSFQDALPSSTTESTDTSSPQTFKYFRSPLASEISVLTLELRDSQNRVVIRGTTNSDYSGTASGTISSNWINNGERGQTGWVEIRVKMDSFLNRQQSIVLQFSDKFSNFDGIQVVSQSGATVTSSSDSSSRKATLLFQSDAEPGTEVVLNISLKNPTVEQIDSSDAQLSLQTRNGQEVKSSSIVQAPVKFFCAQGCSACGAISTSCFVCQPGYYMHADNICRTTNPVSQYPPYLYPFALLSLLTCISFFFTSYPLNCIHGFMRIITMIDTLYFLLLWMLVLAKVFTGEWKYGVFVTVLVCICIVCCAIIGSVLIYRLKKVAKIEKIGYATGIGQTRWGVVGKRKEKVKSGWRWNGSKDLSEYPRWHQLVDRGGLVSVGTYNLPLVFIGIFVLATNQFYAFSLELAIVHFLDSLSYIGAYLELKQWKGKKKEEFDDLKAGVTDKVSIDDASISAYPIMAKDFSVDIPSGNVTDRKDIEPKRKSSDNGLILIEDGNDPLIKPSGQVTKDKYKVVPGVGIKNYTLEEKPLTEREENKKTTDTLWKTGPDGSQSKVDHLKIINPGDKDPEQEGDLDSERQRQAIENEINDIDESTGYHGQKGKKAVEKPENGLRNDPSGSPIKRIKGVAYSNNLEYGRTGSEHQFDPDDDGNLSSFKEETPRHLIEPLGHTLTRTEKNEIAKIQAAKNNNIEQSPEGLRSIQHQEKDAQINHLKIEEAQVIERELAKIKMDKPTDKEIEIRNMPLVATVETPFPAIAPLEPTGEEYREEVIQMEKEKKQKEDNPLNPAAVESLTLDRHVFISRKGKEPWKKQTEENKKRIADPKSRIVQSTYKSTPPNYVEDTPELFKVPSNEVQPLKQNKISLAVPSRYNLNRLRDRLNNTRRYLEIVYEEDEEDHGKPIVKEQTIYDEPGMVKIANKQNNSLQNSFNNILIDREIGKPIDGVTGMLVEEQYLLEEIKRDPSQAIVLSKKLQENPDLIHTIHPFEAGMDNQETRFIRDPVDGTAMSLATGGKEAYYLKNHRAKGKDIDSEVDGTINDQVTRGQYSESDTKPGMTFEEKLMVLAGQYKKEEKEIPPSKIELQKGLASKLKEGTLSGKEVAEQADELGLGGIAQYKVCIEPEDHVQTTENLELTEINGQPLDSFLNRNMQFADGKSLPLTSQDPEMIARGIYVDSAGRELRLGNQDPKEMRRGLVRDPFGQIHELAKINSDDLARSIWRDLETGKPILVNGQDGGQLASLIIQDNKGNKINLRKQGKDNLTKGIILAEGGKKINIGVAQKKEDLENGEFVWRDGNKYRWADQTIENLQKGKVNGISKDKNGKYDTTVPIESVQNCWKESERDLKNNPNGKGRNQPSTSDLKSSTGVLGKTPREIQEEFKEFFGPDPFLNSVIPSNELPDNHPNFGPRDPKGTSGQRSVRFERSDPYLLAQNARNPYLRSTNPNNTSKSTVYQSIQSSSRDVKMPEPIPDTLLINLLADKDESFDLSLRIEEGPEEEEPDFGFEYSKDGITQRRIPLPESSIGHLTKGVHFGKMPNLTPKLQGFHSTSTNSVDNIKAQVRGNPKLASIANRNLKPPPIPEVATPKNPSRSQERAQLINIASYSPKPSPRPLQQIAVPSPMPSLPFPQSTTSVKTLPPVQHHKAPSFYKRTKPEYRPEPKYDEKVMAKDKVDFLKEIYVDRVEREVQKIKHAQHRTASKLSQDRFDKDGSKDSLLF